MVYLDLLGAQRKSKLSCKNLFKNTLEVFRDVNNAVCHLPHVEHTGEIDAREPTKLFNSLELLLGTLQIATRREELWRV